MDEQKLEPKNRLNTKISSILFQPFISNICYRHRYLFSYTWTSIQFLELFSTNFKILCTLSYPQCPLLILLLSQFTKLTSDFCCPFNLSPNVLLSLIPYILPLSSCLLPILQLTLPLVTSVQPSLSLILSTLSPLISYSQLVQQTTFKRSSHLQTTVRLLIKYFFYFN